MLLGININLPVMYGCCHLRRPSGQLAVISFDLAVPITIQSAIFVLKSSGQYNVLTCIGNSGVEAGRYIPVIRVLKCLENYDDVDV